jgi:hypothetical protein
VKIEQLGNPRDYVAAMLWRDLGVQPTPEEVDRLTASLLAAGAFAPERRVTDLERFRGNQEPVAGTPRRRR